MNYHYIVTMMPEFTEESVKYAVVGQNLEWLKKGEITRLEYIESAEPNGDRFNYKFILTNVPVSANLYPLHLLLRDFILSLEEDTDIPLPISAVLVYDPISPEDVKEYYYDLKGETNNQFFKEYWADDEGSDKRLFEKLDLLYYDLNLEYLLDDEMKAIYHGLKKKKDCGFTEEEINEMQIKETIFTMGREKGSYTVPKATTDREKIYFGRYHISSGIKTVIFPNYEDATNMPSVIKSKAFAGCDTLKEVYIYDVIGRKLDNGEIIDDSSFGEGVFYGCSNLEKVYFYNDYTFIPSNTFENCELLNEVQVSSSLREIGEFAFYGCRSLKDPDMFINTNLEVIGYCAFCGCGFTTINLPETLKMIDEKAFSGSMLERIVIPDSVYSIGQNAFESCKSLKEVKFSGEIDEIPVNCFANCYELKYVDLPNGLKRICDLAFSSCMSLENIAIPDGVEEIGSEVFKNCSNLKSIRFPASVTSLGRCDFSGDVTVVCKENSYIHKRAIEEKWNFELY